MTVQGPRHETEHSAVGQSELLARASVRLQALLDAFLNSDPAIVPAPPGGVQSAEDLAWQLYTERGLVPIEGGGPAIGEQLDVIGRIVGQERIDAFAGSDDIYRAILGVRIAINRCAGHPEEILAILAVVREIVSSTSPIRLEEYYPAGFRTEMPGLPGAISAAALWLIIKDAKPAGVRWDFLWSVPEENNIFTYSTELKDTMPDTSRGYGNLAMPPGTGGHYMGYLP